MAESKNGFILYKDLINVVRKLPKEKAGELFLLILSYVNDENPQVEDVLLEIAFEPVKQQLKRDLKAWEDIKSKKSEAGKKGMANRWGTVKNQLTDDNGVITDVTKITVNDTVNVTVTDTVTVNDILKENKRVENGQAVFTPPAPDNFDLKTKKEKKSRMPAPQKLPETVEEVIKFFNEKMKHKWDPGYCHLQAHKFFNHYESNGWKQKGGNKIVSWRAAANMWVFRDIEAKGRTENPKEDTTPPPSSQAPRQATVQPRQLTDAEKEKLNMEFIESVYQEYKLGTVKEQGIPGDIYTVLRDKNIIVLTKDQMATIMDECNNDPTAARKRAVSSHFKLLQDMGKESVFEPAPA